MTRAVPAVEVCELTRTFTPRGGPERTALDRLSLEVPEGEVHGLLGPNGAGKTTLCKIVSTVLLPTAGSARVFGQDVVTQAAQVRPRLGIVFGGERGLYLRLSARDNLMYWSALYKQPTAEGRRRSAELLERVGLTGRARDKVETFSRGMKQRLHLARGLIGDPRLLILDEPTTGLDPVAAREFRALVGELRAEGRTVLLTTHDMAEAEAVCDRVTLIDHGRLLRTANPRTIGRLLSAYERIEAEDVPDEVVGRLRDLPGVASVRTDRGRVVVEMDADGGSTAVLRALVEGGVTSLRTVAPSLEEVYVHLIGNRGLATS